METSKDFFFLVIYYDPETCFALLSPTKTIFFKSISFLTSFQAQFPPLKWKKEQTDKKSNLENYKKKQSPFHSPFHIETRIRFDIIINPEKGAIG